MATPPPRQFARDCTTTFFHRTGAAETQQLNIIASKIPGIMPIVVPLSLRAHCELMAGVLAGLEMAPVLRARDLEREEREPPV